MYKIIAALAILGLAMAGQGCSFFSRPATARLPQLPPKLAAAPENSGLKITSSLLKMVDEPMAKALVNEALENNHDLRATALRLKSSGLLLSTTRAARLPTIDSGYTGSRNNQSLNREAQSNHRISLSLAWELDLWGKLADRHAARQHDFQAQEETYCRAMDSLAARVLQSWFRVRANKMRLDIRDKRVGIYRRIEETILAKYKAGLGRLQDMTAARSRTNLARSDRTRARVIHESAVRNLELLLGRYPGAAFEVADGLPEVVLPCPKVPASILANRPDVRAALENAQAAMSVARAGHKELLPAITLTGNIFRDNAQLGHLGSSENGWGLVGNILFPLFNAGRIEDAARAADARATAAYQDLAGIVLQALKEAEDAFATETNLKKRLEYLEKAMADARQSSSYYEARFKEGLATIIELHTARDQELDLLSGILDVKAARISNRIDMALSVGTVLFERDENERI